MTCESSLSRLRQELADWYLEVARELPWRDASDAYHILLSEVILQQTRVDQGMSYYYRFIETWPRIEDLALASEDEVLRLWQGLGYYSRGRNLLQAARMVVQEFDGEIPRDPKLIKRLPGVGPYTQAAVLSFAYNLPYAAVDGNVYRVLSRLFGLDVPIDTPSGQKTFRQLADEVLDREEPGRHNQAMIELGALVCLPRSPRCSECPVASHCIAYEQGTQTLLPIKVGKIKVTERYLNYLLVRFKQRDKRWLLLRRRGKGDIWQGLYELPLVETDAPKSLEELYTDERWQSLLNQLVNPKLNPEVQVEMRHRLTHRLLLAKLYVVEADAYVPQEGSDYICIDEEEREEYAMPIMLDKMLRKLGL